MKRIGVRLSIGYPTASQEDVIEVEDDATEEEIEEAAREWAFDYVDWGYWELEGDHD